MWSRWFCTKNVWLSWIKAYTSSEKFLVFFPTSLRFFSSFKTCLWETVEKLALIISWRWLSALSTAENTSENPPLPIFLIDLNLLSLLLFCFLIFYRRTALEILVFFLTARDEVRMIKRATNLYLLIKSLEKIRSKFNSWTKQLETGQKSFINLSRVDYFTLTNEVQPSRTINTITMEIVNKCDIVFLDHLALVPN